MKASMWTCGLVFALTGCGGMDQGYTRPSRGPLVSDQTLQVPPPSAANWQQGYNRPGATAYRSPANQPTFASGAAAGAMPATGSPYGDPLRPLPPSTPATLAQGSPIGTMGSTPLPSAPIPTLQPTTAPAPPVASMPENGFAPIQQVGNWQEERPLHVVPPEQLPQRDVVKRNASPAMLPDATQPLLMAVPEPTRKPADLAGLPTSPRPMPAMPAQPLLAAQPGEEKETLPPRMEDKSVGSTVAAKPPEEKPVTPASFATETPSSAPPHKMVNSKRIVINYKLEDVGPSGVSAVELWYTRDGRSWHKDEVAVRTGPPYVIEVPEEGMYGFTLVAKNGVGLGKKPPVAGDMPQFWVDVDLTKPVAQLLEVQPGTGAKARDVTVSWSATDRNLSRRPITLLYSEKPDGPWLPMVANIENTGKYVWNIPANGPPSFYTRVEAVDLVGNVGSAQSTNATSIDMSQPTVSILGIEAGEK